MPYVNVKVNIDGPRSAARNACERASALLSSAAPMTGLLRIVVNFFERAAAWVNPAFTFVTIIFP